MSKGILLFARNNGHIDYVKQAYFLSLQIKEKLNLPVTVVTDSIEYLKKRFPDYAIVFDKIIPIVWREEDYLEGKTTYSNTENHCYRSYYDGANVSKKLEFKNETRSLAYALSPYDETLLLDTDIVLLDDVYKHCFEQHHDFLIYSKSYDLAGFRDVSEFNYISDTGVKFYWATVVFFRKTEKNKIFFNLIQHIQENWTHYRSIFRIHSSLFRNDFAFSIAIHIMNGYRDGFFANEMPGKLFYTLDKDICWKIDLKKSSIHFLIEKSKYLGEFNIINWKTNNIHIMNKFSLNRCIDEVLNYE